MLRNIVEEAQSVANKCCPLPEKVKQLATSANPEDKKLNTRLEGFAYLYMIIWTFIQLVIFVSLMVAFYLSQDNWFMRHSDCCQATQYLTRTNNDLPLKDCANLACPLSQANTKFADHYQTIFDSSRSLTDQRPREPQNGAFSTLFQHEQQWVCYIINNKRIFA